jgi:hypothetical protein
MTRTGSKGRPNKKDRLRKMMRETPELPLLYSTLVELVDRSPADAPAGDRTAAIMGAIFIEIALRTAISQHLTRDETDPNHARLFDSDEAPYREFAGRVRLARALGIIDEITFKQLESIRLIRNAFAHTLRHLEFKMEEVAAFFEDFTVNAYDEAVSQWVFARSPKPSVLASLPSSAASRHSFVFQIFKHFVYLMNYPHLDPDGKTIFDAVMREPSE